MRWFWIDTRTACGGIATDERGIIVAACPYYRSMGVVRRHLNDVIREWRRRGIFRGWAAL